MDTLHSLVEQLEAAATELQDPPALELVRTVREYSSAAKLQLLVVGSTGSGRASVVDALLRDASLLPRSPLPKAPIGLIVRYGPSTVVETVAPDGTRAALPPARLRSFLTGAAAPGQYHAVDVQAPCEPLKLCDLRIEPLEAGRSTHEPIPSGPKVGWRDLLAASDFTILVLNATALLSHQERQFVQTHLVDGYGLQRVAIIVNQIDLVSEEERGSILELVRTFLGPYESQPAVLEFSAAEALAQPDICISNGTPGEYPALDTLMSDLVERQAALRRTSLQNALEATLAELTEGLARQQALLSVDQTEAEELRKAIASRRQWLQQRVERTQRKVDTFVGTLIKEEMLRASEGFGEVFRRRLPDEIMQIEDLGTIKRHLPGYIEAVWLDFLNRQMILARNSLIEETRNVGRLIETDLSDLLGGRAAGPGRALGNFDLASAVLRTFVMPRRGKHRAAGAVRMLSLHGYFMLYFNPPLGVLSLAASHVIRRKYKAGMEAADIQAIVAAAASAARELEREVQKRIEEQFTNLAEELRGEVASVYADGIARIEEFLDHSAARDRNVEARRSRLARLSNETIPELRSLVKQLDFRESGTPGVPSGSGWV